ncbi:SDR family NAD(P)-dependent oxidoreductase [Flavobacterium sp. '19STA2R22 D10 B1']|uniref:SDR family NAD(P)-dependent oxidoreductase n=1 Tax=Flavobacterium aerium TaxID=3037261 RepID=UPI00278C2E61|nr:SDR family NAD(P)-dependent oxidoreductase [Flavobacterium sp. '19STA2R22 D10 B1']
MKKDIAIIGISCKYPKVSTPDEFWENLKNGNSFLDFYTDQELLDVGISKNILKIPNYVKLKSHIEGSDTFDYPFFGYTKPEANIMDPQIRALHELVWMALEDAGCNVATYKEKIGLFLAVSDNVKWIAHSLLKRNEDVNPFFMSHIINKNYASTLISYNLNLRGPSYVVDSACSGSLTSVHLACRSLLLQECSIAMAGGLRYITDTNTAYFYEEGMISSKDGLCRAFDADSSGTISGQGGAIVVLKKLEEALKDNDPIYAVIKASATNNDGKRKVGYTAPSVKGQYECIKQTHRFANIPYDTISYIEAHGTATKLGDPIEIEALNKAFENDASHSCAIGSVKTNIGHLDYASGISGLVKTALAINNKMIPASLHFNAPNPAIDFEKGPFYVNATLKSWESKNGIPLRAGVSSFGIGGTNAHVLMEEAPKIIRGSVSRPYQLLPFSAKTQTATQNYSNQLSEYIYKSFTNLNDLAYTLKLGRQEFNYRNFLVYKNAVDHSSEGSNENYNKVTKASIKDVAFVFPGQGSQYFKMGKDLYAHEAVFKKIIDEGAEILFDKTGHDFLEILGYNLKNDTDESLINETYYTQPALFLIEYALGMLLIEWGIEPKYMIGHSLGEYVAACIAEVFTFKDGLDLIIERASLMQKVEKGSMLSIGISNDEIKNILPNDLAIAAVNTADTCVVSGNSESIQYFSEILEAKEIPFSKLKTSHAFHSNMMDVILEDYAEVVNKIQLSHPKYPFISNLTGKEITKSQAISSEYWVKHLRETVRFNDGINELLNNTNFAFIEVGPGRSLSTIILQSKKYSNTHNSINLLRHPKEVYNDNYTLTNALGKIWANGISINWNAYYKDEIRYKVNAPTYNFDKYALDFKIDPFQKIIESGILQTEIKPFDTWFYIPSWKKAVTLNNTSTETLSKTYLLFSEDEKLTKAISDKLTAENNTIITVKKGAYFNQISNNRYELNPIEEEDFKNLFAALEKEKTVLDHIIFNWNFNGDDQKEIEKIFMTLLYLSQNIINHNSNERKKITIISDFNRTVFGNEKINLGYSTAQFIVDICAQENPIIFTSTIDITNENDITNTKLIDEICIDLEYNETERSIAYRNNVKWVEYYEEIELPTTPNKTYLKPNKTYLVTGGLGKVGQVLTTHLGEEYNAKIILLGRSIIPSEAQWEEYLQQEDLDEKVVTSITKLQALKATNKNVFYYTADVSNYESLSEAIQKIETEHGIISGVVHAAGNVLSHTFKPVENVNASIVHQQFNPKINGTLNIYSIFKERPLDFVWITSSLASILGGLGYGPYAVANKFIDNFIRNKSEELKNWFSVNLDGISENRINNEKLIQVFERSFYINELPQLVISARDPNTVLKKQFNKIQAIEEEKAEPVSDRPTITMDFLEPKTSLEKEITELWQSFLGIKEIGIKDHFFELGGDSLKAMTLLKRLHKIYDIEISIEDFFKNPCVEAVAKEIEVSLKIISLQKIQKTTNAIII